MVKLSDFQPARFSVSSKIILLFIDGVGVGLTDPAINPCSISDTGIFQVNKELPHSGYRFQLDAQMDVPGLPQSATGHTTLYTGINAPKLLGKHLTGFPNRELRQLLKNYSLFTQLKKLGYEGKFINAFRPVFFTTPEIFLDLPLSATTEMNKYAGYDFSTFSDIRNDEALYHDYSNEENRSKGFDLPHFSAEKAGEILVRESEKYNLILYEYFLTDFAGHAQNLNRSIEEIEKVERLIMAVLNNINFNDTIFVVVSDHGNIEDIRTKSHTINPAFLGIWDSKTPLSHFDFKSLQDLFPYIYYKITGKLPEYTP